jgi:riboflavin biosynthesis pyrimidine reductase
VRAGHDDVDLRAALDGLGALGAEVVLAEGGPTLNGHLLEAGLVDEWCLTAAPWLVGGPSGRASAGPVEVPVPLRLMHVAAAEQLVFLRYLATHGH